MNIKDCEFEIFKINNHYSREGILLRLHTYENMYAETEISPLPGFSKETVHNAYAQLHDIKQHLLTTKWTKDTLSTLATLSLYPSVYFAVETALLDLLFPEKPISCKKYALLLGSYGEIVRQAEKAYERGYRDAKVKLGIFTPEIAHRIIKKLINYFTSLRLDLNRKWEYIDTMKFFKYYPENYFYYVEEPCKDPKHLPYFSYPYALDETLRDSTNLLPYLQSPHLKALILKPTMTYPLSPYLSLGPEVVITNSFESPVGISQIERLISRLQLTKTTHGLETY